MTKGVSETLPGHGLDGLCKKIHYTMPVPLSSAQMTVICQLMNGCSILVILLLLQLVEVQAGKLASIPAAILTG